ncbi:membrane bound O-acyl transferase family-domain-containing protein [Desarmillaria tabescens]|uniref:Membrane bound O-acyl transferase family-domain-containing protein n=1 Tax=Armillaria tabescens TaxID=1929756 RepID=A0AA39JXS6_ARMTA|nr:membrane bound O-acyl transferase family-domain-containing protein [Desarmillaria tabescens]KAK0449790.1 membrane bound O-acyl transferase family-domain-containing protein [Desarmillaria tabescens]
MEGGLVPSLITFLTLFSVALAIEPTAYRTLFFLPIASLAIYIVFFTTTSNALLDSTISGWTITVTLYASDYLVLTTDVQQELHKCDQQAGQISDKPFLARLQWAAALCFSPRGVGWAHQPAGALPPRTHQSAHQIWLKIGLCLLLLDAGCALNGSNPAFANRESIAMYGVKWRFFSLLGFGMGTLSVLNIQHFFLLLVTGERDTPALFGRLEDAYTVQRFWGKTWHQCLRKFLLSHGHFVAYRVLRLRHGSYEAFAVQVHSAFLISGLLHQLQEYSVTRQWAHGSMLFFYSQVGAISLEQRVIVVGKKLNFPAILGRGVGYCWVLGWFTFILPFWLDPMTRTGMFVVNPNKTVTFLVWSLLTG